MEKISRFIHVLDDDTLFDAINKKIIKTGRDVTSFVSENKHTLDIKDVPLNIRKLGIITTEEKEEEFIKDLIDQTTDKYYQGLYLITSTTCNLDCDYCFYRSSISGSLKEHALMSFDVAKKAVDKFYDIVLNNPKDDNYWQQITLYGGEPMTNKELLIKIIPYIKEKFNDKYTDIVINTNLTLLDEEIAKIIKDNNVIVQVSIDGDEKVHDLHRKTIDGKGSYKTVIENAKKLVAMGVEVIPMITATNDNVDDFSNITRSILESIGVNNFYSNVLISGTYDVKKEYFHLLASAMADLKEKVGVNTDFSTLYDMVLANDKRISRNSCGCTRKITVFPNGQVYVCQAMQKLDINNMGILGENFENNPNHSLWLKRNKFRNPDCLDCEVVASCGAGCAAGSYNSTGSIYGTDYNQCMYNKELFNVLKKKLK